MRVITILALILLLLPAPLSWCSAAEGPAPNGPAAEGPAPNGPAVEGPAADGPAADQPAQQQADQPTPDEPTDEPAAEPEPVKMTPEERADAEIGRTAAEAVDEQYEFIEESPDIPRIDAIIQLLRPVTEKPHQTYRVKVIDSNAINAFAIPGGYLYYSQGLLQAVESDDELAAITGHE
ncbi:MAG: M48 family metalloprotease, partial [Proteobacteria bacterium]|nr:M48 family metalloprotease [Pseudomonadota bacterium]